MSAISPPGGGGAARGDVVDHLAERDDAEVAREPGHALLEIGGGHLDVVDAVQHEDAAHGLAPREADGQAAAEGEAMEQAGELHAAFRAGPAASCAARVSRSRAATSSTRSSR